ncbi:2-polyprenyl-6-methoxyphenol hydroxylase-like oxidoreductase [Mycolicibacterium flavescens]|uniref:FAD-dependent oxidoreductase n=1 Tax=Mycobacterium neumannii TaxID=2048551 RepID=UPI000F718E97|nr:FAD-dependent monooxygenase [Mycobacterium neumannii]VEG45947.1 2-polyprenyl-6-methoxyphenol hydroxylase-like oxidoreductase [Mycolicibacterium flavescens]
MPIVGERAVVLGASMAGLLTARVLADSYRTVTVVERDALPTGPTPRRGVPQGKLIHALLARGAQVLEELLPGILDELVADGAVKWDGDYSKLCFSPGGHRLVQSGRCPSPDSMPFYFQSRPFLDWHVLRRMREVPNVTILERHDVVSLRATTDRSRVTGVDVIDRDTREVRMLDGDLVVDATGRGSRTPLFLEQLGYDRPPVDEVVVQLAYACQPVRIRPGRIAEHFIAIMPEHGRPRMFATACYENDATMFAIGAMAGHQVPDTAAEMLDFVDDFVPPDVLAALADAEPLGPVVNYRVPSNRWRRYDKMRRLPDGLLVLGDAVCSFNPIYGQGMTVAAVEATVLRDCLRRGDRNLARRFFRSSAKTIRIAWQTAVGSDLALPEVEGTVPLSIRLSNAYLERVLTACETDAAVTLRFLRVLGMVDPPAKLFSPAFMWSVLRTQGSGYRRAHAVSATHGDACAAIDHASAAGTSIT